MTNEDKYKYWDMLSEYDIQTAYAMVNSERWVYVAFLCEQSIERLLKGMYVFYYSKEAPKSHNINFLISCIQKSEFFRSKVDQQAFREELARHEDFLDDLVFYYISDYPFSYQKIMDRFISEETAKEIFNGTNEVLEWLGSLQKPVRLRRGQI
ncbi:MAG: HEPN domain-containing protein [Clostridia bacterium]|nr:HEPN domain-containing protein [Clostridia bacterium]MDR3645759.1 HEPN domain-containing protein [Clostridia bacterium]